MNVYVTFLRKYLIVGQCLLSQCLLLHLKILRIILWDTVYIVWRLTTAYVTIIMADVVTWDVRHVRSRFSRLWQFGLKQYTR